MPPGGLFCAIGNPLSDGTWTYTWENGRQLKQMQSVDTTASFVYNESGLRVQKTVNGVVTNYTLHGKNIVHMTSGSDELHFFYDAQNKPAVVVYNGVPYSYVKNLQGDVVALLDSTGVVVVKYVYDAWGRPISKTGTLASTLGTVQPFRYRGYVYDEETGVYYLRSRYYSSISLRFLNADDLVEGNLYCYCNNCLVSQTDPDGHDAYWITASSTVYSFGHTSLLLQDPVDSSWYYFYWGSRNGLPYAPATVYVEKIDIETINGIYLNLDALNSALAEIHGEPQAYSSAFYFPGDFSNSLSHAKQLRLDFHEIDEVENRSDENAYNLLVSNCLQVSAEVMKQSYSTKEDREVFDTLAGNLVPNQAYVLLREYTTLPRTLYNIFDKMVFEY